MKKTILILTSLVSLSSMASLYNCTQNEAQFIGTVKDLRVHKIDQGIRDCYYKIEFSSYQAHGMCPLDEVKATATELLDYDCMMGLQNGDQISGYLVEKNGTISLEQ